MSDTAVRKAWRGKRGRWSLRLSGSDGRALGSSCKHNCGMHVSLTIRDFLSTRTFISYQLLPGHIAKKCTGMYTYLNRTSKQASTALGDYLGPSSLYFNGIFIGLRYPDYKNLSSLFRKCGREIRRFHLHVSANYSRNQSRRNELLLCSRYFLISKLIPCSLSALVETGQKEGVERPFYPVPMNIRDHNRRFQIYKVHIIARLRVFFSEVLKYSTQRW